MIGKEKHSGEAPRFGRIGGFFLLLRGNVAGRRTKVVLYTDRMEKYTKSGYLF
jgi:hypothetical protein